MSVRSFTDTQLPTSALRSGLLGIGVQKSLRAEVRSDTLIVDTGTAADDGLITPRRQGLYRKTRSCVVHRLSRWVIPSCSRWRGVVPNHKTGRTPLFFWGVGGLVMRGLILAVCLVVVGGCGVEGSGPGDNGPGLEIHPIGIATIVVEWADCEAIDSEISAVDDCAPAEGIWEKWSDIRSDVCAGRLVDCSDILSAVDYVSGDCPCAAAELLEPVCKVQNVQ